jgi:hypothetical protein
MLREDNNAQFFKNRSGFLWRKRFWFVGTGCPPVEFKFDRIQHLYQRALDEPVAIARLEPRTWWLFGDVVYWENAGYSASDVKALLLQRERQKQRQLDRAHALMAADETPTIRREGIPKDVKQAVFERDQGRCAECGAPGPLEFDHIIPLALGGANSVKNLQLLCIECNREKGASL